MKRMFLLFSVILIANSGFSQTIMQTIRGTIVDKDSKTPLPAVTVILLNSNPFLGTTSNPDGSFRIDNVPIGRRGIKISMVGYNDKIIDGLLLSGGKEIVLDIELEEKVVELNEVVVKAHNRKDEAINEMAMVSARSFTIEETERFAGSLGDPARMVANYAGVMTQNDSRNDIIIRGNSPMGVLWRIDGIEVPNPNHFGALGTTGGPVSMINNNLLTNSDFLTGAFPAEYGNATAGAFDLHLRNGNNEKREYVGQIGFNGFEFGAEGPFSKNSKASYLANYRYSTLAVMHYIGFGTGTGTAIPYYQDLTFKVNIPNTKLGNFSFIGLGGKSHIFLRSEPDDSAGNAYNQKGGQTNYASELGVLGITNTYFLSDKTYIKTSISGQGTVNKTLVDSIKSFNPDTIKPYYRSHYIDIKYSLSSQLKTKFSSTDNASVGFVFDFYNVFYKDSFYNSDNQKFQIINDKDGNMSLFRAFGQWQHKFTDQLSCYAGIHYMNFIFNGENSIEPRFGLKWQFRPNQSVNLGYGKHSQIQPRMVYFNKSLIESTGEYIGSNEKVKMTKSDHYVLGYNLLINNDFRFKAETYFQYLYNVPVSKSFKEFSMVNAGDFFAVPSIDSLINNGTGKNYGVEITIEKFLSKGYYFLITASLFDSKYKGYDKIERNTAFNGNYVFNILGGYEFKLKGKNYLTLDVKGVWAGGKRYTPYVDAVYNKLKEGVDAPIKLSDDEVKLDWSNAYSKKYNDYFRVDLRIGVKMNGVVFNHKFTQEWGIDLQNLLNYKSIFSNQYDNITNQMVTAYQQGFYPMMLYRIQF